MHDSKTRIFSLTRLDRGLPEIYLVLGLTLTGLLCFVTAPFFGPDEPNQACRAIQLGHGTIVAPMGPLEGGGEIDTGASLVMDRMSDIRMRWESHTSNFLDRPFGPVAEQSQLQLAGIRWTRLKALTGFGNTAGYPPGLYLPAMLGWRIGESADLTIFASLRLARALCALYAVVLGWLALRVCACSRWMLLPFLLLPSTLFLNATCSQDAALLSVAGLAAALTTRPLVDHRLFTATEVVSVTVLFSLCAMARPPYATLGLLLFLPTAEMRERGLHGLKERSLAQRWLGPAAAFSVVLLSCGVWRRLVSPLGLDASDEAAPDLQEAFLRAHPLGAGSAMLKGTGVAAADFFHRGLYVVGWNDLLPHRGAATALAACLIGITIAGPSCPLRSWAGRLLLTLTVAGSVFGISLAEYIIWTPPGLNTVFGVQPRYWLPIMPFAMMLLQGRLSWPLRPGKPALLPEYRTVWLLGTTCVLAGIACTLPLMVSHAFYRESLGAVLRLNLR